MTFSLHPHHQSPKYAYPFSFLPSLLLSNDIGHKIFSFLLSIGNKILNLVPTPGLLSQLISPPCSLMMLRHTERPSPVPSPTGFVVKNGSKIFSIFSGEIPQPVSATVTWTNSPSGFMSI